VWTAETLPVFAQAPPSDAITWVGVLSGGVPVAALLLVICWFLYQRDKSREASREERERQLLDRIDSLQEERLKERDTLLRDVLPVLRDSGEALVRATVLWAGQANQAGGR
jgi:hypothetical protein